jgi:hypothetical protein
MNLLVMAVALVIVFLLSIYALTRKESIDREIAHLTQYPREHVVKLYQSNRNTFALFILGGFLLTAAFALIFFGAGGVDPRKWALDNAIYAVIGLVAVVAITAGQATLYSSISHNTAAFFATLLILVFVIFSEVATSSEREDAIVRDRSMNSPVLNAVVERIKAPDALPANHAPLLYGEAARFESLAFQCKTEACKRANLSKATAAKAQATHADNQHQTTLLSLNQGRSNLIEQGKSLEYVESNHTAVIRWLKNISASTYSSAMLFASLIFVIAFESGFHFAGTKHGIYKEALILIDSHGKNGSAKHVTRHNSRTDTLNTASRDTANTAKMSAGELAEMERRYTVAKELKSGDSVECPTCQSIFTKKAFNQCFCKTSCKDIYWNVMKPERLVEARGGFNTLHNTAGEGSI